MMKIIIFQIILCILLLLSCSTALFAYPVKITENGIFLKCHIGNKCGYCKFDTGSLKNYLMPHIKTRGKMAGDTCFSAYGESPICSHNIRLDAISLNGKIYRDVEFVEHTINLYSFSQFPVLAIIGLELFGNSSMKFDLKNKDLKISSDNDNNAQGTTFTYVTFKNKMFVEGTFGEHTVSVLFDTGASKTVVNSRFYNAFSSLFEIDKEIEAMDGMGVKENATLVKNSFTPFSVFEISKTNITFLLINLETLEKTIKHPIDFILGSDLLATESFTINFPKATINMN